MNALFRWCALGFLLALRIPSLVQPAGADQSLYAYIGLRILGGGTPYVDAWDQKPPGIHLLYAVLWWLWPDERVVAAADLAAAIGVCALLIVLGRRLATAGTGWLAACIFAFCANPSLQRLSGVFVRSQCETFIALAVTAALVLVCHPARRRSAPIAAGVLLGAAIWLKYNAVVFALPIAMAMWLQRAPGTTVRQFGRSVVEMTAGAAALGVVGLAWLAWRGALTDLWLATFVYNVAYSSEGYAGPGAAVLYMITLPFRRARYDLLWFLGLAGVAFGAAIGRTRAAALVASAWIGTAIVAIALNGRDLPQYFVQASPAMAFAGALGLAAARQTRRPWWRAACVVLLVVGFWRIGTDTPVFGVARLGSVPGLAENIRFDLAYWRGAIDRAAYLDRFGGGREQDKYAARDVEELAHLVRTATAPTDTILVFGFSPGVYVKAQRESASRFFWGVPVLIEFAASRPGYGSQGLLEDLVTTRPALVALQKGDGEPDSQAFFMGNPGLSGWLEGGYRLSNETSRFAIWRRIDLH